jgi:carboxylesterase type B
MQSFFQQAIIQSAPMAIPFRYTNQIDYIVLCLYDLRRTYAEYIAPGVLLAEQLHCAYNDIACFRAASVDNITAAQKIVNTEITSLEPLLFFEPWVPVIDNIIVYGQLYETIQNVSFPLKPLILGTLIEEGLLFIYKAWNKPISPALYLEIGLGFFREKSLKVLERYPPSGVGDQRPRLSQIATQWVFACPTRVFARKAATYFYVFGYPLNYNRSQDESFCNGHVCHGDELPFLFESKWINFTDTGRRVSQSIANYWTNFGKTQNPNEPLRVSTPWPRITTDNETYMYFQDPLEIRENYLKYECDFWDTIGYRKDLF